MPRKSHPLDKTLPAGFYGEVPRPPQIVDVLVESGAMRSKSKGFVPAVVLTLTDENGNVYHGMMRCDGDEMLQVAEDITRCAEAARNDVKASTPGKGKSHGPS
jgi:hypothetical protein